MFHLTRFLWAAVLVHASLSSVKAESIADYADVLPVWEAGYDGRGTAIVIVDGPIDNTHPMLREKVMLEACFSSKERAICGPNARVLETGDYVDISKYAASCSNISTVACEHATHVAGVAAGALVPGGPTAGIAKGAEIVAVKVMGEDGITSFSSILLGLTWITGKVKEQRATGVGPNIVAVNMSFGGNLYGAPCDDEGEYAGVARRIRELKSEGVAVFAAAGNDSSDKVPFPACLNDTFAIAAVDANDKLTDYTNYSTSIKLGAYGNNVLSSNAGGGFAERSGTSFTSAMAAGAFAVLKGAFPDMSFEAIVTALEQKGRVVTNDKNVNIRAIDVGGSYAFLRILASEIEEERNRATSRNPASSR
jgi:serine protease